MLHKSHLNCGHLLDNLHIGAAQVLLQRKFSRIGGLQNTVMQDTDSLKQFTERENLQVVHVKLGKTEHWIALSTVGCADGEIEIYDSLRLTPTAHTQKVIARYPKSKLPSITIKVVNAAKREGASDCGLYAIAI